MSDWIEWDGGECPVPGDTRVEVRLTHGLEYDGHLARAWDWSGIDGPKIVAYRIVKEDPQTLNKPETVKGFEESNLPSIFKIGKELKGNTIQPAIAHSGSKYLRNIQTIGGKVDVYAVLEAFAVTCPARQHAIKKLLCAGLRGKGDSVQDLKEAADAVARAVQMEEARR